MDAAHPAPMFIKSGLRFERRNIWVIKPPDSLERLEPFEFYYHIKPNLDKIIEENKKRGLETLTPGFMKDLSYLIESEFGHLIFDESQLDKAYGLGLDLSSFDNLRTQLQEDYGLEIKQEERVLRLEKVKFN